MCIPAGAYFFFQQGGKNNNGIPFEFLTTQLVGKIGPALRVEPDKA
jgi:hypothetical protein